MGRKHLELEDYLLKIPEIYRGSVVFLEPFKGKRTLISFVFSCGCKIEQILQQFLLRDTFEFCTKCKPKKQYDTIYKCNYCHSEFFRPGAFEKHKLECENKYKNLQEGEDYIVCAICGFHSKCLSHHISTKHNISIDDYKKNYSIICNKSHKTYSDLNGENGNWIARAKERGEDLSEYISNMSVSVHDAIMASPEDRKRRAKVMGDVNRSDIMRKKSSDTAKKTSARRDIQLERAARIHVWQKNNPQEFYDKCISKALNCWNSKPESLLYKIIVARTDYNFRRHQRVKSEYFISTTKEKEVDIGDKSKRVYIEFDGPLHFKDTTLHKLDIIHTKDKLLDDHITRHGWVLIRVGSDQFSYRKSDYGFKKECIDKIFGILDSPTPGVHYIGEVYDEYYFSKTGRQTSNS